MIEESCLSGTEKTGDHGGRNAFIGAERRCNGFIEVVDRGGDEASRVSGMGFVEITGNGVKAPKESGNWPGISEAGLEELVDVFG